MATNTASRSLARALEANGIHYGWLMVGLIPSWHVPGWSDVHSGHFAETDVGRSRLVDRRTVRPRMALFGLVAPFAGGLILLYGPRKVLLGSAILPIAGLLVAITMTARWQLWISLGIAMGVAPGMTVVPC